MTLSITAFFMTKIRWMKEYDIGCSFFYYFISYESILISTVAAYLGAGRYNQVSLPVLVRTEDDTHEI